MEDIDIWRTAQLLVTLHKENAPIVAAQRLDAMLDSGDLDGRIAWRRIAKAIETLLAEKKPNGATLQ